MKIFDLRVQNDNLPSIITFLRRNRKLYIGL